MMKRVFYVVVIVAVFVWIFYSMISNNTGLFGKHEDPFKLVPNNASLIFEVNDFSDLREKTQSLPYQANVEKLPFIEKLHAKHDFIYEIFGKPVDQKALIVAHLINAEKFDFIYLFDFYDSEISPVIQIKEAIKDKDYVLKEAKFNDHIIYKVLSNQGALSFNFYFRDGILLGSFNEFLLEEGITHWDKKDNSVSNDGHFIKVKDIANRNADATIYLNYEKFPFVINGLTKDEMKNDLEFLKQIGTWCSLDLSLNENAMYFTGYSLYNDTLPQLLSNLKTQSPQPFKMHEYLPSNTALLVWLGASDFNSLLKDKVSEIQRQIVNQFVDNEMGVIYLDNYNYKTKSSMLVAMKLKDGVVRSGQIEMVSTIIDSTSFKEDICRFDRVSGVDVGAQLLKSFQYDLVGEFTPRFFTIKGDYIFVANNLSTIKNYLYKIDHKDVLSRNVEFLKFQENLSSEANIIIYQNTGKAYNVLYPLVDKTIINDFPNYYSELKKFYHVGIELTNFNDKFFTNVSVLYDKSEITRNILSWEIELDAPINCQPTFVKNHKNGNKEIIVQDETNTLYLVNMEGEVLWKVGVDGKILSEIKQVDLYANNKLQYLFNTKDKIYAVDRNGKMVENYPIHLKSPASNSLFLIDYAGKKDYRYFICCEDGNMYGYKKTGKLLSSLSSSWPKKVGVVDHKIKHMEVGGKDYFIITNKDGEVYLLNRKGEERIPRIKLNQGFETEFSADFSEQPYQLVAGGKDKKVYSFDLQGNVNHYDCLNLDVTPTAKMYFEDINGDRIKDYIYVSNQSITAVGKDSSVVFDLKFSDAIKEELHFVMINNRKYLGVFGLNMNEFYLLDSKGSMMDGFPVKGYRHFDIMKSAGFSYIVTGSEIGKLFLYSIKE